MRCCTGYYLSDGKENKTCLGKVLFSKILIKYAYNRIKSRRFVSDQQQFRLNFFMLSSECVGAIGSNCSVPCPSRFYGKSCKLQCQCSESQCDRVKGCLKISKGKSMTIKVSSRNDCIISYK